MKQVIIYIALFVLAAVGVIIIEMNHEPVPQKAMTVGQYYSIMDVFQGMDIPLYLTDDHHLLTAADAYERLYLANEDETKKLNVTLSNISIAGVETYLGETYTKYMLEIELPYLTSDYDIDDCYLLITLLNGNEYQFNIGMFSYINITDQVDDLFWTSLEAIKEEQVTMARIKMINVSFETLNHAVETVSIGLNQPLTYVITNGMLTIDIAYDDLLLYGCPIAIYYVNGDTQVIDYFNYLTSTTILNTSGPLNHTYDISSASQSN